MRADFQGKHWVIKPGRSRLSVLKRIMKAIQAWIPSTTFLAGTCDEEAGGRSVRGAQRLSTKAGAFKGESEPPDRDLDLEANYCPKGKLLKIFS